MAEDRPVNRWIRSLAQISQRSSTLLQIPHPLKCHKLDRGLILFLHYDGFVHPVHGIITSAGSEIEMEKSGKGG